MYIEELIGPDTVNTMPDKTIVAFLDHGVVERTIDKDMDKTHERLAKLESLGISLKQVTDELTVEGVESFTKSFTTLESQVSRANAEQLDVRRICWRSVEPGGSSRRSERVCGESKPTK